MSQSPLPTEPAEFQRLVRMAFAKRARAGLPDIETNAYRLIHDRHDRLDGLVVERLGTQADIRIREARFGNETLAAILLDELTELGVEGARFLDDRPRKHDAADTGASTLPALEALAAERGMTARTEAFVALENTYRFEFSLADGFSHGLFLDMRQVRADVATRWRDRRVANLFAYTCGFGVYLARENEVTNVDVSRKYLEWGKRNYALNEIPTAEGFVVRDAFEFLEIAKKRGHQWDAIVLDPPVYSRGKAGKSREFSLRTSLAPLIHDALSVLRPGGELLVATNLAELGQKTFTSIVDRAARDQNARLTKQWGPGPDFPAVEEEYHLKTGLVVKR